MSIFRIVLVLLIGIGASAQERCFNTLIDADFSVAAPTVQDVDLSSPLLQKFEAKQRKIDWYLERTGNAVTATVRTRDQKMARLNHYLSTGDARSAVQLLKESFYSVEKAYRLIEAGRADRKDQENLGENITEYVYFRAFLERVTHGKARSGKDFTDEYKSQVTKVLERIGISANEFGVAFAQTGLDKHRPALDKIKEAYERSEIAIAAKLDMDLTAERYSALRAFAAALTFQKQVQSATAIAYEALINKVPGLNVPFRLLAKSFRDSVARNIDLYKIKQLVLSQQEPAKKLENLRSMWASQPDSTLLVSFVRFQDDDIRKTWVQLKAEAEKIRGQDAFTQQFWDKIQGAEKIALDYGPISEYFPPTPMDTLSTWIVTGGTFGVVLYHQLAPHDWPFWQSLDSLMSLVHFIH